MGRLLDRRKRRHPYPVSDSRIRYVRAEERVSLGQARQRAIDLARGEWIAFLDQDDIWLPYKLERQMALAHDAGRAGLIYGRAVRFYPNGTERDYDQMHEYAHLPEGDIFAELFANSCFIAMSSAVFRRSAIAEIGGIPDDITIIPDYYLYTAIARRFPAAAVQEVVCRYRMHAGNTSRVTALQVQEEALRLMDMWGGTVAPEVLDAVQTATLHRNCFIGNAPLAHSRPWHSALIDGRIAEVTNRATVLLRLSPCPENRAASALEDAQARR